MVWSLFSKTDIQGVPRKVCDLFADHGIPGRKADHQSPLHLFHVELLTCHFNKPLSGVVPSFPPKMSLIGRAILK